MFVCINDLPSFTLVFINYSLITLFSTLFFVSIFSPLCSFLHIIPFYVHTYIYTYICTYAHTCVHTHTYTTSPFVSLSSVPRPLPQSRETPFSSHPLYSEVSQTASSIFVKTLHWHWQTPSKVFTVDWSTVVVCKSLSLLLPWVTVTYVHMYVWLVLCNYPPLQDDVRSLPVQDFTHLMGYQRMTSLAPSLKSHVSYRECGFPLFRRVSWAHPIGPYPQAYLCLYSAD